MKEGPADCSRTREGEGARHEAFGQLALDAFRDFVAHPGYPCLGAKATLNAESFVLRTYERLAGGADTEKLAQHLLDFVASDLVRTQEYASFIAVFQEPASVDEAEFERLLWAQLRQLDAISERSFPWDASVSPDPADPHFSFSFGGKALYVVGLHRQSAREARRFRWPALVFNPHEQFEKLRGDGKWARMQHSIRERDIALQGFVNPMLNDFGETSEARQYSGRVVDPDWKPEFPHGRGEAGRCPFAH